MAVSHISLAIRYNCFSKYTTPKVYYYIENHIVSLSSLVSLNIEEKLLDISISSLQLFIIMTYQMILTSDKRLSYDLLLAGSSEMIIALDCKNYKEI